MKSRGIALSIFSTLLWRELCREQQWANGCEKGSFQIRATPTHQLACSVPHAVLHLLNRLNEKNFM